MPSDIGRMPVIDNSNDSSFINPVINGHQRMCSLMPRDYNRHPAGGCGFAAIRRFPTRTKAEIIELIKLREAEKSGLKDILTANGVKCKDQDGLPYCWIYATTHTVEVAYSIQGNDGYIPLSATAAGTIITGGVSRGGYGAEAVEFLATHGTCREIDWPEHQINMRYATPQMREMAKENIITDWCELQSGDLDQLCAAVLSNFPVSIGLPWWRHQVTIIDLALLPGNVIGFVFDNSWGTAWGDNGRGILTPQKAQGDMFMPVSVRPRKDTVRMAAALNYTAI